MIKPLKIMLLAVIVAGLGLNNVTVCRADEYIRIPNQAYKDIDRENGKGGSESERDAKPVESKPAEPEPVDPKKDDSSETTVTNTSMPGDTTVFIGLGVAGLAALGIALGTGGGGGDDSGTESTVPPPASVPPVGPSIEGSWSGELRLSSQGTEAVSAEIIQNGEQVEINVSTSFTYGRHFTGTISRAGYMYMMDGDTGQTWTTLQGNATENHIRLYDYVNNHEYVDRLELFR